MMRFTLMSAAAISAVSASVSTSVFPNSLCQGASDSLGGLVGVGKVTLANGEVEVHCGCPSDNLADFEACPSSQKGESVCNSVYDMQSGRFSAACDVVECSGADCLDTIVNEVVTSTDECFNSERGSIGISTVDGESQCACSSDVDATGFTACEAPAHGKATCSTLDADFLGTSYDHPVQVSCGVVCDEGYTLTLDGTCTKIAKRDYNMINMGPGPVVMYGSSAAGPSKSMGMGGSMAASSTGMGGMNGGNGGMASASSSGWYNNMGSSKGNAMPTTTSVHPHQAHTTAGAGGSMATASSSSYSYKHHNGHKSKGHGAGYHTSGVWAGASSAGSSSSMMMGGGNNGGMGGGNNNMMTTSSGANHNAKPTTTMMGGNNMMPTTTSYSYKHHNGHMSSMGGNNGGSMASSASRLPYWSQVSMAKAQATNGPNHWAHKRDAIPTAAPAYVLKQHDARAPANLHRRASSASGMYMGSSSMMHMGGSSMPMMPMVTPTTSSGSNHAAHTTSGAMMGGSSSTGSASMATSSSYSYKHHHMGASSAGNGGNGGMMASSSYSGPSASNSQGWYQPMPSMGPSGSNHNAHPMASSSSSSMMMGGNGGNNGGNAGGMMTSSTYAPGPSASHGPSASQGWYAPAPSMGPSGSNHNSNPSGSGSNNGNGMGSGSGSNNGMGSGSSSSSSMMMNGGGAATTSQPMKWGGSSSAAWGAAATPGPSQRVRRASNEYVFSDVCAQDERTCPGDIMCVRLDDVTECGGCHATGDAVNCLEIPGASSVSCLRGGCVVRSCQTGYFQTAEGRCERL